MQPARKLLSLLVLLVMGTELTQVLPTNPEESWQVYSSAQDSEGRCICTVVAPQQTMCSRDARTKQLRQLLEKVQNMSQSIEVLDRRTQRDLQYVEKMENIVISKLDPVSLQILQTWNTSYPKRSAGEAFIICGTLYVTNGYSGGTKVHYAYQTNASTYEYIDIPFQNKYSHISMLDYNPKDRALYAWNNGHQTLYNVTLFHVIRSDEL